MRLSRALAFGLTVIVTTETPTNAIFFGKKIETRPNFSLLLSYLQKAQYQWLVSVGIKDKSTVLQYFLEKSK
jgi:hypothetical protein